MTHHTSARPSRDAALDTAVDEMLYRAHGWRFGPGADHRARRRAGGASADPFGIQPILDGLEAELGFRLPAPAAERLRLAAPTTPAALTDAVFAAVGLDPDQLPYLRDQVRARVESGLSSRAAGAAS